jgi:glutaminyl-tRNA synthetase
MVEPKEGEKLKGVIQWVSQDHALTAETRIFNLLFTIEDPMSKRDQWKNYVNPDSMIIKKDAKVWGRISEKSPGDHWQFERVGYFTIDPDTTPEHLVLNRVVELRESKEKKDN